MSNKVTLPKALDVNSMQRVAAIVLNWNNWKTTAKCVRSLIECKDQRISIILIDNASDDDSVEQLESYQHDVTLLKNKENIGFARGCNVGISHALSLGFTHILLINNDVLVERGFLDDAINEINANDDVFAVTGKILMGSPENHIWQAGGHIDMFRIQGVSRGFGEYDEGQYNEICDTNWASGAFTLFPSRTFTSLGLLPEEYFFGQEEWDFSRKITTEGKLIKYVPTFRCVHSAGDSYRKNHPILLTYGCYLNKNIFAKRYLGKYRYRLWRILFAIYVKHLWPSRARNYVTDLYSLHDYICAANLAISDFDRVQVVTRYVLINASTKLNIPSSWRS